MNNNKDLSHIRDVYNIDTLSIKETPLLPFDLFDTWIQKALDEEIVEATSMTLSTCLNNIPSARTVLLKEYNENGYIFYTNYQSAKGKEIESNPNGCLLFFWKELQRQVRITGVLSKISSEDSDAYFAKRPQSSQIGAITSPQSNTIPSHQWLEDNYNSNVDLFKNTKKIKRPEYWGGYILKPTHFEFWQGRPSRLHDRITFSLNDKSSDWDKNILAP